jgi:RNase P subunit RPR2
VRYEPYSNMISSGTANEVKKLKCPECDSVLKITYVPKEHAPGLYVQCLKCDFLERHRLVKEPQWVSELGNEFETF